MERVYWRPPQISAKVLAGIAALALAVAAVVEQATLDASRAAYDDMLAAARRARQGLDAIDELRRARGLPLVPAHDPARTGLIGSPLTPVTSVIGSLRSKQTSVNPDWAAVVLWELRRAGVKRGDVVACAFSGSFPALNLAVCAALETLGARPIVISSAAASQWGANRPSLLWLDMERALAGRGVISFRSAAASLGGHGDRAQELGAEGRALLLAGLQRCEVPRLEAPSVARSVRERIALYRERAAGAPIAAYVNVGGGAASVGGPEVEDLYRPGLNLSVPAAVQRVESVMGHFAARGVPILHLSHVVELARRFGLPVQPRQLPSVGTAGVYHQPSYDRRLAAGGLALIVIALLAFVRSGRLISALTTSAPDVDPSPQPMV